MAVSEAITTEKAFPRGGRDRKNDNQKTVERKVPKEKDLFSSSNFSSKDHQAQKKQRKRKLAKQKAKDKDDVKPVEIAEALSYGQLVEGMIIMGRISIIKELEMRISLPGRLMVSCPITNISSAYTNALKAITQGNNMDTDSDEYPRYISRKFHKLRLNLMHFYDYNNKYDNEIFISNTYSPYF